MRINERLQNVPTRCVATVLFFAGLGAGFAGQVLAHLAL